jgi:Preprotein translocase subunit SecA (ATPase, RNA helicase)
VLKELWRPITIEPEKNLIGYDDVINVQRKVIYSERNKVLDGVDLREEIRAMIKEVIGKMVKDFLESTPEEEFGKELENLVLFVEKLILLKNKFNIEELYNMSINEIDEKIYTTACEIYDNAETAFGEDAVRSLEKSYIIKCC